jgi:hypothetical protein
LTVGLTYSEGFMRKNKLENLIFKFQSVFLLVLFMCTVMSRLATVFHDYQAPFWPAYANTFYLNLVFALPLQFLIVGPLVRTLFIKVFPTPITAAQA